MMDEEQKNLKNGVCNDNNEMGVLGRGWGYLGLPVKYNKIVRYFAIWLAVFLLIYYFKNHNQDPWLVPISIAVGIIVSIINSKSY